MVLLVSLTLPPWQHAVSVHDALPILAVASPVLMFDAAWLHETSVDTPLTQVARCSFSWLIAALGLARLSPRQNSNHASFSLPVVALASPALLFSAAWSH